MNSNAGVTYTGNTYIEVDICHQHLWYYVNGELFLESDVVTGKESDPTRATPPGAYKVWSRESPRKLGTYAVQGYETWVNYWMPVTYTGIGLHDLNRSAYGGDIYINNGSHGCINLPPSVAKTIFDNISAGTPVICYNLPGTEKSTTSGTAKPAETKPAETQAPAPAETQAPGPAPTTAPTQAETKAPETAAPTQAGPGGPSGDNGGNIAVGPGA